MSTFSLPRLINGGGYSHNRTINYKYATINGRGSAPSTAQLNGRRQPLTKFESDLLQRRKAINRNGSIARNQFRGIKTEHLEKQTTHIIHSMTVCTLQLIIVCRTIWIKIKSMNLT